MASARASWPIHAPVTGSGMGPPDTSMLHEVDEVFRRAAVPLAVVDPSTVRLIAVNREFADLLRLDPSSTPGLHLFSFVPDDQQSVVEQVLAGVGSGRIDFCQGRGRWVLPNGEELDLITSVRPLDPAKPTSPALLATVPTGRATPAKQATAAPDSVPVALGAVDHEWRFSDIGPDAEEMFGWSPDEHRGTPVQAVVHPEDVPHLLLALGRSSADRRGILMPLRVRGHDGWTPVRCTVTPLCEHNPPRFAFAIWTARSGDDAESVSDRLLRLEDHLWRIAFEVQAAGIRDLPTGDVRWTDPVLRELSERQREIVRRLLRGERVPAIARELFLSDSTVRNHLSAIYRRFGVHSQQELLARVVPAREAEGRARDPSPK